MMIMIAIQKERMKMREEICESEKDEMRGWRKKEKRR